jgi:hypothetical protein
MKKTAAMMWKGILFFLLSVCVFITACKSDKDHPWEKDFSEGAYVVNEGKFGSNTGSLSYYDPATGTVVNDLFYMINHRPLGDVVQSMAFAGDTGYIVVNGSNKIEVVDLHTFLSIATISGINYPRHFLYTGGHIGLVTAGNFQGTVYKIDLQTLSTIDQVMVGNGPENLVMWEDKVYVANSGGWTYDSTLSVINLEEFIVEDTLVVGDQPIDLSFDGNGNLWVLCSGKVVWNDTWTEILQETDSRLTCVHMNDYSTTSFVIGHKGDYYNPRRLAMHPLGNRLYFDEADGVYAMDIPNDHVPEHTFLSKMPYGIDMDAAHTLYLMVNHGFDANGTLFLYREDGTPVDSLEVGIAPNEAVFRYSPEND